MSNVISGLIGSVAGFVLGYAVKPSVASAACPPCPQATDNTKALAIATADIAAAKAAGYTVFDNKLGGKSNLDVFSPTIPPIGMYAYKYIPAVVSPVGTTSAAIVEYLYDTTGKSMEMRTWLLG